MRRAHVKHKGFCSCGKVVCGNGGRAAHRDMHERRGDGHRFLVEDAWVAMWTTKCETCDGSGSIDDAEGGLRRCLDCGGRGLVRKKGVA